MVYNKTFQISDKIFWGFKVEVDLDQCDNIDKIIEIVINKLNNLLKSNNLELLQKKLNETKFHIHDFTFEDILLDQTDKIFYICGGCPKNESKE